MRLIFTLITMLFLISSFTGCKLSHKNNFPGGYSLWASDTKDDMALMVKIDEYDIGVVSPRISAYMYNDSYIAVIQVNSKYQNESDEERYYIVPLKNKISENPEKNLIGPLSQKDFMRNAELIDSKQEVNFIEL